MIYIAKDLLCKLTHLTLVGYEDGSLIWVGNQGMWDKADKCSIN